jgi:hypothetical protein
MGERGDPGRSLEAPVLPHQSPWRPGVGALGFRACFLSPFSSSTSLLFFLIGFLKDILYY